MEMDEVKGFRKWNNSKTIELFEFDKWPGFRVETTFSGPVENQALAVNVKFEESDRKAVADLFRKMADSLDPVEARQYFGVLKAYDRETESNTVEIEDATICNLRRMSSLISYEVGDRVHVIRIGNQYYLNGRVD